MEENFVAEAWSLLAIALVMIGLRIYARLLVNGYRHLKLDDALMVLAGVSNLTLSHFMASRDELTGPAPLYR